MRTIVGHLGLGFRQILDTRHVLVAIVCKTLAELFTVHEYVAEHTLLRVLREIDTDINRLIGICRNDRPAAKLPSNPFTIELQIFPTTRFGIMNIPINNTRGIVAFILCRNISRRFRAYPAAKDEHIAFVTLHINPLLESNVSIAGNTGKLNRISSQYRRQMIIGDSYNDCVVGNV